MKRLNKDEKLVFEIFREMYAKSTPSADFDKLYEEAEINSLGQRVIDYNAYEIEKEVFDEILDRKIKGLNNYRKHMITFSVSLGPSPKFKSNN